MDRKLAGLVVAIVLALGTLPTAAASLGAAPGEAAGPCPIELPQGDEPVTLDPADFVVGIDNPYWPMAPGSRWVYRESDLEGNAQKVTVRVTMRTREILGIDATVVHDVVTESGEPVENTFDWYAQDVCGNVWYMGESTKEYEDGEIASTAGSWEAGVDGAQAGVIMPAGPQVGMTYRQEHYEGQAEDAAAVLSLDEQAQVAFGHFRDVLLTKDFTTLERRVLEYKLYAKGIGPVLVLGVSGGSDRDDLLRFRPPA